jgi:hypothetical protein
MSGVRRHLLWIFLSARAAALMRSRCTAEKPPEVLSQSWPGFAPHNGQSSEIGLMGRTSGMEELAFAMLFIFAQLASVGYTTLGSWAN